MAKAAKKKAVAKTGDAKLPATEMMDQMAADTGGGFENTTSDDYAIPFITLLQKMSPQVDEDDSGFIKGAKVGMFFNSVTQEMTSETIRVVPCARVREIVEWIDREEGGGMVGRFDVDDPIVLNARRDGAKMFHAENGHSLMDTRYHYVLVLKDDGTYEQAVISMASTQIKASKQWMTRMRSWMVDGPNGMFNPPMYGQIWTLDRLRQENDSGSWYGFALKGEPELVGDGELYAVAKGFGQMAESNEVRRSQEPGSEGGGTGGGAPGPDDEIPF